MFIARGPTMPLIHRLTLHHALAGFALGLFLAVQTLFLKEKGIDLWHIGLLFGAFGAATACFELPLGALADIHGRVRIYRLSRLIALTGILLAVVMDGFWGLFIAMTLLGVSRALDSGSIQAWQLDHLKAAGLAEKLPNAIARFHSASAAAIASGALLGGYLPGWVPDPVYWKVRPTEWNLLAQAAITALHLLMLGWLFKEGDPKASHSSVSGLRHQLRTATRVAFQQPKLLRLFACAFLVGLVLFALEAYWQPRVLVLAPDTDYAVFGWLASGYFLAAAAGPMVLGWVLKRIHPPTEQMIFGIMALLSPLLMALALQSTLLGYAPTYLLFMLVLSMVNVPFEITLAEEAPNELRSTLFSILSLALQTGGVVMAYGLSVFVQWIGIDGLWIGLASLLGLNGLFGLAMGFLRRHTRSIKEAS